MVFVGQKGMLRRFQLGIQRYRITPQQINRRFSFRTMTVQDIAAAKIERRKRFEAIWPPVRDELVAYLEAQGMPGEARDWFKKVRAWQYIEMETDLVHLESRLQYPRRYIPNPD